MNVIRSFGVHFCVSFVTELMVRAPCAPLPLLSSFKKTSNRIWTSYRVSSVCNHGTFWTSIRAIGEYPTRRTWTLGERTNDERNGQQCTPCTPKCVWEFEEFECGRNVRIYSSRMRAAWMSSTVRTRPTHTTAEFIEFHRRLMFHSIWNRVAPLQHAVNNELRRL